MKVNIKLFTILGVFFIIVGTIYGFWVRWTEWAGIPALYAVGAMVLMIAFYLQLTDNKYGDGPSDESEGEISEYAGEYGRFAPWSWWPLGLGTACAIIFAGLAIGWWVFYIGIGAALFFLVGWVFEYSKGDHAH